MHEGFSKSLNEIYECLLKNGEYTEEGTQRIN